MLIAIIALSMVIMSMRNATFPAVRVNSLAVLPN
jgi:hypothetical protein